MSDLRDTTMQAMTKISTPIKLTFTNLRYTVRARGLSTETSTSGVPRYQDEVILKDVSGYMLPG